MSNLRSALHGLYAITDPALIAPDQLQDAVGAAIRGGASVIQYRNKTASPEQQRIEAGELAQLCQRHGVALLINDDVDLALAVGADGVHIGQSDGDLSKARSVMGPDAIIGVSCHASLELAQKAQAAEADYVAFGRFFASRTKPLAPAVSIDILQSARDTVDIPIVAIGGITPDNGAPLVSAGADMLAAIHGLFGQPDIEATARQYLALFKRTLKD